MKGYTAFLKKYGLGENQGPKIDSFLILRL